MSTEARSTCWGKERWLNPFTFVPTNVTLTYRGGDNDIVAVICIVPWHR
jgi:hypothetical protein